MTAAQRATLERMLTSTASYYFTDEEDDALRAALGTCGNCEHAAERVSVADRYTFCAAPNTDKYPFLHKQMPLGERCTGWTAKEGA